MKTLLLILFTCALTSSVYAQQNDPLLSDTLSTETQIRRPFRVSGTQKPLFILGEKEITEEEVGRINPNDIQSISVVKDSTAITNYGERGRFGVITIELRHAPFRLKEKTTH